MSNKLEQLRSEIDKTDSELVRILAQRLELTQEVGRYKYENRQPLYVPEREAQLLAARREEAREHGIDGALIEDVLRRVMRESYQSQKLQGFNRTGPDDRPVIIVGGKGKLGGLFAHWFEISGYSVVLIDKDNQHELTEHTDNASLVLISVPIDATEAVIESLPELPSDCILADLTSVKSKPLNAMLRAHSGPVIGLHPMFGPSVPTLAKQTVLITPGRDAEACLWLSEQLGVWGVRLHELTASEHDHGMSLIQVMRHLSTFVYGYHLAHEDTDIEQLVNLSSPIYRLELMMVGRLFAQSPELYADIILSDQDQHRMIHRYLNRFSDILELLATEGREGFVREFNKVAQWFGPYASQFMRESVGLLRHTDDSR